MKNLVFSLILLLPLQAVGKTDTCPVPGEPINWVLRYCALMEGTDDEIALQKGECFHREEKHAYAKKEKCQIKREFKKRYCENAVQKYKTHSAVEKCVEDAAVPPFIAQ